VQNTHNIAYLLLRSTLTCYRLIAIGRAMCPVAYQQWPERLWLGAGDDVIAHLSWRHVMWHVSW